jgi:uncharacterized protein (TIGR03435 family)
MHHVHAPLLVAVLFVVPAAIAQPLTFDAASVKPAEPLGPAMPDGSGKTLVRKQPGGGNSESPGRIHYRESLGILLTRAYDIPRVQIQGPDWLGTVFVVDAVMPPQTTKEQLRVMLQNLLVERFKLAAHRETKQLSGYSLVVTKNGPKLKVWTEGSPHEGADAVPSPDPHRPPPLGLDGFPAAIPLAGRAADTGISMFSSPYGWKVFFFGKTMPDLADELWERLRTPVRDATGLTAKYDFSLAYLPDNWPPGRESGQDTKYPPAPDLFKALESQLGLKLEKGKVAVPILIVDHIEKTPTGN